MFPWYKKLESLLAPARGLTTAILIGIAVISIFLVFVKSNAARVAWVVYVLSP